MTTTTTTTGTGTAEEAPPSLEATAAAAEAAGPDAGSSPSSMLNTEQRLRHCRRRLPRRHHRPTTPFIVVVILFTTTIIACFFFFSELSASAASSLAEDYGIVEEEEDRDVQHRDKNQQNSRRRRRRLVKDIFADEGDDDVVKVLIGYNSLSGRRKIEAALVAGDVLLQSVPSSLSSTRAASVIDASHDFDRINAVAVQMTKKKLMELEYETFGDGGESGTSAGGIDESDDLDDDDYDQRISDIAYFERDHDVYMLGHDASASNSLVGGVKIPYVGGDFGFGIRMSDELLGIPTGKGTGNCSDPETIKVAVGTLLFFVLLFQMMCEV